MENSAVINLKTLKSNAKKIKEKLPKSTLFCAVVKANAYGHGIVECANALYTFADYFAVATVTEGEKLRLSGIDKPILVLSPLIKHDAKFAIELNLTLAVDNLDDLRYIVKTAKTLGRIALVHISVNTGMNRLGVDSLEQLRKMLEFASRKENLLVTGVYSHLACPENGKMRNLAVKRFNQAKKLAKSFDEKIITHISASGGFLKGEYHDMVRIGILLYGYKPFRTSKIQVKPIMKIYSPVLMKRQISSGDYCGYGSLPIKSREKIAIIRYGYADGLDRKAIDTTLNNRCMDLTAVTDCKKNSKFYAVLEDADKLAKKYNTISYEILCKSAMRAEKIYLR